MQKLIMPMDNCKITAGYKSPKYKSILGFNHYGVDLIDKTGSRKIKALGKGLVVACGMDGNTKNEKLGNVIVIIYRDVILNKSGKVVNLVSRMYHMDKILVKVGQKVNQGDIIGYYGNTGAYTSGAHLHIEFDTDINYPTYAYGIGRNGKVIKHGTIDSTIPPSSVFWLTDSQSFYYDESDVTTQWINRDETSYPYIKAENTVNEILSDIQNEIKILKNENRSYFERLLNLFNNKK